MRTSDEEVVRPVAVGRDTNELGNFARLVSANTIRTPVRDVAIAAHEVDAGDDIACCSREETGEIEVVCRNRNIVLDCNRELAGCRTGLGVAVLVRRQD